MTGFSWTGSWAIFLYVVTLLVLLGTFIGQGHAAFGWLRKKFSSGATAEAEPTPELSKPVDIRLLGDITPGGGSVDYIDFHVEVVNYGTRQARCSLVAHVAETEVECRPPTVDLLPTDQPKPVRIIVPRPQLGDLIAEFNNESTLYDQTLRVAAKAEDQEALAEWHEHVYTSEENNQRAAIQQRKWRTGRGEETESDRRMEYLSEIDRRAAERAEGPDDRYIEL